MKSIAKFAIALSIAASTASAQLTLDNFNSGSTTGSALAGTSWVGNVTQGASTITVNAKDDNGWGVTGLNLNASAYDQLTITGQVDPTNVWNSFTIQFNDANLNSLVVSVNMSQFSTSSLSVVNVPIAWTGGIDPTAITDWSIGGGSTGTFAFRMTLDNIALTSASAVPEPATYALILGGAAVGLAVYRRRRLAVI